MADDKATPIPNRNETSPPLMRGTSRFIRIGVQIALAVGAALSIIGILSMNPPPSARFLVLNCVILSLSIMSILILLMPRVNISVAIRRWTLATISWLTLSLAIYIFLGYIAIHLASVANLPQSPNVLEGIVGVLSGIIISFFSVHWGWLLVISMSIISLTAKKTTSLETNANVDGEQTSLAFLNVVINSSKWPLAVGAILILFGILVLLTGSSESIANKLTGALISELGFAFFIAYVLGITLEIQSRLEHDRKIGRGILSYIYGIDLDNRMFFHTENHIFKSPFYRKEATVEYDFFAKEGDRVLIKQSFSYLVQNISQKKLDYAIKSLVERPDKESLRHLLGKDEDYGLNRLYVDGKKKKHNDVIRARKEGEDTDEFLSSSFVIPLEPGQSVRVKTINITEKYIIDTELWRSLRPCDGITLVVRWDRSFNLDFFADSVHPGNGSETEDADADPTSDHGDKGFDLFDKDDISLTASVHQPLFPHNGIHFWWRPKQPEPASVFGNATAKEETGADSAGPKTG